MITNENLMKGYTRAVSPFITVMIIMWGNCHYFDIKYYKSTNK